MGLLGGGPSRPMGARLLAWTSLWIGSALLSASVVDRHPLVAEGAAFASPPRASPSLAPTPSRSDPRGVAPSLAPSAAPTTPTQRSAKKAKKQKKEAKGHRGDAATKPARRTGSSGGGKQRSPAFGLGKQRRREGAPPRDGRDGGSAGPSRPRKRRRTEGAEDRNPERAAAAFVRSHGAAGGKPAKDPKRTAEKSSKAGKKNKTKGRKAFHAAPNGAVRGDRERDLPASSLERPRSSPGRPSTPRKPAGSLPQRKKHSKSKPRSHKCDRDLPTRKMEKSSRKKKRRKPKTIGSNGNVGAARPEQTKLKPPDSLHTAATKPDPESSGSEPAPRKTKTRKKKRRKKIASSAKAAAKAEASTSLPAPSADGSSDKEPSKQQQQKHAEEDSIEQTMDPTTAAANIPKAPKSKKRKKRRKKKPSTDREEAGVEKDESASSSTPPPTTTIDAPLPLSNVEATERDASSTEPQAEEADIDGLELSPAPAVEEDEDEDQVNTASPDESERLAEEVQGDESPTEMEAEEAKKVNEDESVDNIREDENKEEDSVAEGIDADEQCKDERECQKEDVDVENDGKDESTVDDNEGISNASDDATFDEQKSSEKTESQEVDGEEPVIEMVVIAEESEGSTKNDAEETEIEQEGTPAECEILSVEKNMEEDNAETKESMEDGNVNENPDDVGEESSEAKVEEDEVAADENPVVSDQNSEDNDDESDDGNKEVNPGNAEEDSSQAKVGEDETAADENPIVSDQNSEDGDDEGDGGDNDENPGNAEEDLSQAKVQEDETAVSKENYEEDHDEKENNSDDREPDQEATSSKNEGSVDPEQDVVSFIEEVLQENVSSWIDDTSTDSNVENVVNKTRGGHSDDLDEVDDDDDDDDEEALVPEQNDDADSTVLSTINEISEASDSSSQEPNEKLPTNRDSLETLGDKDSDTVVSIVTWNLAEDSPSEEDAAFIRKFRKNGVVEGQGSDFVLISGQECENIKPRRSEGRRSREYRRLMIKMLGKEYVPLALHLLGGIQFGLFAKRSILEEIEDVCVADVTCGIGNVFHNKGAIAAFVKVKARNDKQSSTDERRSKSLRMVFVTAHLAAHVKNADARDSDFWRISSELEAQAPEGFLPRKREGENPSGSFLFDSVDRVFFCGDLNYRLDLPRELTEHTLLHKTSQDNPIIKDLLRHDQLIHSMAGGKSFPAFAEGKITFMPTFKYDKESSSYDTSHKQRIPAWTDRILFQPSDGIRVLEYQSVPGAQSSDHRPVFGSYRVGMEGRVIPPSPKKRKRKRVKEPPSRYHDEY